MAKKSRHAAAAAARRRKRRSPEEIIQELQAEIQRVRERAQAKKLVESNAVKAGLSAIRAIDKGMDAAARENNARLRHAFADARRALSGELESLGVELPKASMPKGPRPK